MNHTREMPRRGRPPARERYGGLFEPIVKPRLSHEIRRQLQDRIADGRLPAATKVHEATLARELGVSRTPLHEAMASLERDRLVESLGRRGWRIAGLREADARELYPVLGSLEALSVNLSNAMLLGAVDELRGLFERISRAGQSPPDVVLALESDWHSLLLAQCPNRTLVEILRPLLVRAFRFELAAARENWPRKTGEIAERRRESRERRLSRRGPFHRDPLAGPWGKRHRVGTQARRTVARGWSERRKHRRRRLVCGRPGAYPHRAHAYAAVRSEGYSEEWNPELEPGETESSRNSGLVASSARVTAAAAAPASPAASASILFWSRFADVEGATFEFVTVQGIDCGDGLSSVGHGHEGEPTGPSRISVGDDMHVLDGAMLREQLAKRPFGRVVAEIAHVNLQGTPSRTARPTKPGRIVGLTRRNARPSWRGVVYLFFPVSATGE